MKEDTTHFGYQTIPTEKKVEMVKGVFDSVASKYDIMNDVMSFGLHRAWKKFTIQEASVKSGQKILDVAAGTGDLSKVFAKLVGRTGEVVMSDINSSMLNVGRNRMVDAGVVGNVSYVEADAENLPFESDHFDCVTIAFGLRNVTDKDKALASIYRVLKPGGKMLILEFSKPLSQSLNSVYDCYSFNVIPFLGKIITGDKDSYQYLVESIRKHPDQDTLKRMMIDAGFEDVLYHNLSGGIVALHKGFKY